MGGVGWGWEVGRSAWTWGLGSMVVPWCLYVDSCRQDGDGDGQGRQESHSTILVQ